MLFQVGKEGRRERGGEEGRGEGGRRERGRGRRRQGGRSPTVTNVTLSSDSMIPCAFTHLPAGEGGLFCFGFCVPSVHTICTTGKITKEPELQAGSIVGPWRTMLGQSYMGTWG